MCHLMIFFFQAEDGIRDGTDWSSDVCSSDLELAGYGTFGRFAETPLDGELAMIQVNIVALTELTKRLLPPMIARGRGRILNLASTAAFVPGPDRKSVV